MIIKLALDCLVLLSNYCHWILSALSSCKYIWFSCSCYFVVAFQGFIYVQSIFYYYDSGICFELSYALLSYKVIWFFYYCYFIVLLRGFVYILFISYCYSSGICFRSFYAFIKLLQLYMVCFIKL